MQNIVLDTNIFVQENFLEGKRIKEFLKLSEEKYIQLVVTQITIDEIKDNFKKRIKNLDTEMKILRKVENKAILNVNSDFFPEIINQKQCISDFNKKLDDILVKSNVTIIDYTEINIKNVFDAYFQNESPFHKESKKHEFPDAFIIEMIKKWCIDNGSSCVLLSKDNDFEWCKNPFIEIYKDYKAYLDNLLRTKEEHQKRRIDILNNIYLKNLDKIDKELKDWYTNTLEDDETLYQDAVNWYEIHDISVSEIEILSRDYKVIYTDEESIEIEVTANLKFTVVVTIDDINQCSYDSEDKVMHYFGTTDEIIEQEDEAKIVLSAWIISDEEFDEDLDTIEVCKDKKIEIDNKDHYW